MSPTAVTPTSRQPRLSLKAGRNDDLRMRLVYKKAGNETQIRTRLNTVYDWVAGKVKHTPRRKTN